MEIVDPYTILAAIYDQFWGKFSVKYVSFLQSLWERLQWKPRSAIDIGCGTGCLLNALASEMDDLVGIDISPQMIQQAMVSCARLDNVRFMVGDMRSFDLSRCFDLALCCFDTLNYLPPKDVPGCIARVSAHLTRGGVFVCDVVNERHFLRTDGTQGRFTVGNLEYEFKSSYDNAEHKGRSVFVFEGGTEVHYQFPLTTPQMERALQQSGMALLEVWSDLSCGPVSECSERYYIVATKE